jgi:predicted permease
VRLSQVDLGFDTGQVLVMETSNPISPTQGAEALARVSRMYEALLAQLIEIPGIQAVGAARVPPGRVSSDGAYAVDGAIGTGLSVNSPTAVYSVVSPGTFAVLGIPIVRGRAFSAADAADAPLTAIVNETLVQQSFPGVDPIGHSIMTGFDRSGPMVIVGVVGDIRQRGPGSRPTAEVYMPYLQHALTATALRILARTSVPPESVIEPIRQTARKLSPDMPVRFTTMDTRLAETIAAPRFRTLLLSIFAAIAVVLTIAGAYGVSSYLVNERAQEIGLRMALGASGGDVLRMVLVHALWMGATGLLIGLAGAAGATSILESILFEIRPFDPSTYLLVAGGMLVVTVGACVLPARRASRIDPIAVLRE